MSQTIDEITDALNDYSDWEEVGSVERAKKYITAARRFIGFPESSSGEGKTQTFSVDQVREELLAARAFVQANDTSISGGNSTGVRVLGVGSDFRR